MKICKNCKTTQPDESDFCQNCGEVLPNYETILNHFEEMPAQSEQTIKTSPRTLFIIAAIAGILVVSLPIFLMLYSSSPSPSPSINYNDPARISELGWEASIKRGDEKFDSYDYHSALAYYQRAKEKLDRIMFFERDSPKGEKELLQRYYNKVKFIEARIELTSICIELGTPKKKESPG